MSTMNRPYFHESLSQIIVKKDRAEISNWTESMELINEELQSLILLEKRVLGNPQWNQQLVAVQRENQFRLGVLYRYERTMTKAIECDTTECDAYYLNTHEKNRNGYMDHVRNYVRVKTVLLSKVMERLK